MKSIVDYFNNIEFKVLKLLKIGFILGSLSLLLLILMTPTTFFEFSYNNIFYIDYLNRNSIPLLSLTKIQYIFIKDFFFTGLFEELCKLISGFIVYKYLKNDIKSLYFNIIMASLFFAFIENITYFQTYGSSVVFTRSVFSTTAHLFLGVITSYFVIHSFNYKNYKRYLLIIFGILISSTLHGSFNFFINMNLPNTNILIWIIIILLGTFLLNKSKKVLYLQ